MIHAGHNAYCGKVVDAGTNRLRSGLPSLCFETEARVDATTTEDLQKSTLSRIGLSY